MAARDVPRSVVDRGRAGRDRSDGHRRAGRRRSAAALGVAHERRAHGSAGDGLPEVVADAVYRIARHASTLTDAWYREQLARGIDPIAYVEMVGVVVAVAAVDGFFRAAGLERPPLPSPSGGEPHGRHPQVEAATLNWVPVAAPADRTAAVVQGLSAAPDEWDNVCRLAAAQYIPVDEMGELGWSRGTLTRAEMELVAARLSTARECFF